MTDDHIYDEETVWDRVVRRTKEHPVVVFGVGATIAAFVGASYGVRTGRREFAQYMFRARVGFQFFTLAALLGGGVFYDQKRKDERAELERRMIALQAQQEAAEVAAAAAAKTA
ncbi:Respiratory supercomplex factor 1, mitochondrial [Actinomortierella ambigua]|uniref:Respiratory supercomplex factor 1, mitochondrial n=1 Tax=Actinomortierella ambigua TaxID=1343610 RepID=A0A9P6U9N7_9FUNG|nr:Respiratory supercomplex factor 1, mitochondrial [Actinomortierella ambigua]KAG0265496.1 Respiratory supercomplex factor 1, mitochondrial [Actinomortierella ambigua]